MIDEKKLAGLRTIYAATAEAPESRIDLDAWEVIETLEHLWMAVRAAMTLNSISNFGDQIYDVRAREMQGWEGPKVVAYGKAVKDFEDAVAVLEPK